MKEDALPFINSMSVGGVREEEKEQKPSGSSVWRRRLVRQRYNGPLQEGADTTAKEPD